MKALVNYTCCAVRYLRNKKLLKTLYKKKKMLVNIHSKKKAILSFTITFYLTLYNTIMTFDDPQKEVLWKHC